MFQSVIRLEDCTAMPGPWRYRGSRPLCSSRECMLLWRKRAPGSDTGILYQGDYSQRQVLWSRGTLAVTCQPRQRKEDWWTYTTRWYVCNSQCSFFKLHREGIAGNNEWEKNKDAFQTTHRNQTWLRPAQLSGRTDHAHGHRYICATQYRDICEQSWPTSCQSGATRYQV